MMRRFNAAMIGKTDRAEDEVFVDLMLRGAYYSL
jgi:hypothetical protein